MSLVLLYPGVVFEEQFLEEDMLERLRSCWLPLLILSTAALLWTGCSELPGGGGGGISSEPRFIEGTFASSPKTGAAGTDYKIASITFTKEGKFTAYRTEKSVTDNVPDIEGSYEVVDKDIVFKNQEGVEFQNRGIMLDDGDTKFEWTDKFPGDVFTKK